MNKIKIIHIVNAMNTGGMENGIVNLCNGHNRERFEPSICCLKSVGVMASRLKPDVRVFNMEIPEGWAIPYAIKLARFFRRIRPHVIHTHGFAGGSYFGIVGARLAGIPVIINGEHGVFYLGRHRIVIQKILSALCHVTFSVSESLKMEIMQHFNIPSEKIWVIPNGVDTALFSGNYDKLYLKGELEKDHGLRIEDKSLVVGSIGSLKPLKNQMLLLRAIKKMNETNDISKRILVIFIGDGQDLPKLKSFVEEAGLNNQVAFLGIRDNVPQWLSVMDLLISTTISKQEGLSNVILEAMSSGLPVISTKSIGSSELITESKNGFIIEPDDVDKLCDTLKLFLQDKSLLDKMGQAAQQMVYQRYSIEKMISGYEDKYMSLLEKHTI